MTILSDLLISGGTSVPLEHGGSYKIQYKEGADFIILNATDANFSVNDLNTLQSLVSLVRAAHNLEAKV